MPIRMHTCRYTDINQSAINTWIFLQALPYEKGNLPGKGQFNIVSR